MLYHQVKNDIIGCAKHLDIVLNASNQAERSLPPYLGSSRMMSRLHSLC